MSIKKSAYKAIKISKIFETKKKPYDKYYSYVANRFNPIINFKITKSLFPDTCNIVSRAEGMLYAEHAHSNECSTFINKNTNVFESILYEFKYYKRIITIEEARSGVLNSGEYLKNETDPGQRYLFYGLFPKKRLK